MLRDFLLEDCPDDADQRRIHYVAVAVHEHVPDAELVNVVIAGDFAASVQDRSHDPRERAGYDVDRMFGTVAGKTICSETSQETTIILPWETFSSLPELVLYRLASHEALHAALHQRDEGLISLRLRLGLDVASAAGLWAELAGAAIDEYRIERALNDEGLRIEPTNCSSVPQALSLMQQQMGNAVRQHVPQTSIEPVYDAVANAFHRVSLHFAYAAAEELATDGEVSIKVPPDDQRRLLGNHYDQFRDVLARIPPAATPTEIAELKPSGEKLAEVLQAWLHHIGFDLEDREGVGKWFQILQPTFLIQS